VTVSDHPGDEGTTLELKPVTESRIDDVKYREWVRLNRQMVDSLSGGRLAYIHIPAMNMKWQKVFEEELVSIAEPKEGLVIDVRNNGGGWTAVNILGELVKSPYILRAFRSRPPVSENKYRSKAYEKSMTLLINNYSGSNAEIFAEGFRKLGLGTIVGTPTGGGVIGTASYTLIDGTRIRRPSTGAYTTDLENTELVPRQPDVFVELLPDDYLNGRDPQLAKAVEELVKEL
jgi:tricorn protease